MRILGIESSCDETAAAVVEDGMAVRSNVIASTKEIFSDTGGVVPEDAARRQVECILPVVSAALNQADVSPETLDAVAVTKGPGLLGSLLVGTTAARTLAALWEKPLIGVHHTFGHLSSVWLECDAAPAFPVITLSASGGHTDLWYRTTHTKGVLLGRTRDDAAGEAFDKGAAMLGLSYPGGPSVAKAGESGNEDKFEFPVPLKDEEGYDFSFSGLKTALKYTLRDIGDTGESVRNDLAASYQLAICTHLKNVVERSLRAHPDTKEVHVVGGVSANVRLRELLGSSLAGKMLRTPAKIRYCTDNAAMIAAGGFFLAEELGEEAYAPFHTAATLPLSSCVS